MAGAWWALLLLFVGAPSCGLSRTVLASPGRPGDLLRGCLGADWARSGLECGPGGRLSA